MMLRHCTITELLDLRDGDGTVAAREHVAECAACRAELDRLHQQAAALKALPSLVPPRNRWPAIRGRVLAARRRTRWLWMGAGGLAAAAVAGLIVVGGAPRVAPEDRPVAEVRQLVEESQRLENVLRSVGQEGRVVNGFTAAAITDLEDRIAAIDAGIAAAQVGATPDDALRDLWRQRVALMDALVTTHVRQVGYVGF